MQNKFTLIIPTKNRHENLLQSIPLCLDQNYDQLEVIISDNFSTPETFEVVRQFKDPRLKYVRANRPLSMSENFDFALSHASGGYIMMLGDDDGPVHGCLDRVNQIMTEYQPKALVSSIASYSWPNHPNETLKNGLVWSLGDRVERRESKAWLKRMLSFEPLYTFDLPGVYCGFVHYDVIRKLFRKERFFFSQIPDAYSAFACAGAIDHYYYSHRPFVIHGASGRSNGASYLTPKADKEEIQSFIQSNNIPFHPKLVLCPSFRVIAAEAFLRAKEVFPEEFAEFDLDVVKLVRNMTREKNGANSDELESAIKKILEINHIDLETDNLTPPSVIFSPFIVQKVMKKLATLSKFGETFSIMGLDRYGVFGIRQASQVLALMLDQPKSPHFKKIELHKII